MEDFINYVHNLNATTLAVVIMLVAAGAYILNVIVDSMFLSSCFGTAFFLGALLTDYLAKTNGVGISSDPDVNLLLLATVGMIGGLFLMVALIRVYGIATDNSKQKVRG